MNKKLIVLILFLAFAKAGTAQVTRSYKDHRLTDTGALEVKVSDGTYYFELYNTEVIETTFVPLGGRRADLPESHAVVQKTDNRAAIYNPEKQYVNFGTEVLQVQIIKEPFQVVYLREGKHLLAEKRGSVANDSIKTIELAIKPNEILYGGGARALGMNRRGNRLQLYNRAHYGYETRSELMNYTLPIVISSKGYLVHFDNAPVGFLDLDSEGDNTITYETINGAMRYQVVAGNDLKEVTQNYVQLTGTQPMLPRWALGNFASKFGYHSQQEVEETIAAFKKEDIPVDAVILDLYWFGKEMKGTMGNLAFHRDSFPDPRKMIKGLHDQNVETILITEPFILDTSDRWQEAVDKKILAVDSVGNPFEFDFYFGHTGLIDIYKPEGRQWFKDIYTGLSDMGVTGFWGDLGEPEVHPSELIHATGTADEVHNIYGHDWAKLVYEASIAAQPKKRPFILMRAGYSGSQRYGMVPWSGDVNRTWGGLQSQVEIALQMGMQGLGYMHSDLGGFAGANLDDELYARWLQYGVFQPIYRPHAQEEVPSEPVFRSEKAKQLAKKAIELRYKLLPYNYTLMYENNRIGMPLMRPVFFMEGNEARLRDKDSFLWGDDFFIVPITQQGQKEVDVIFPQGVKWIDFYSGKIYEPGSHHTFQTVKEHIPTFVKAGAFIPMAHNLNTTKDYDNNKFELHYYHDTSVEKAGYKQYQDDGSRLALEEGRYEVLGYSAFAKAKKLSFLFIAISGEDFKGPTKEINLIIHGVEKAPRKLQISGKRSKNWVFDDEQATLAIPVNWNTASNLKINLKF
ncbi:MAG: TIM-barrel domain-containing protein [Nonlabens sp.]